MKKKTALKYKTIILSDIHLGTENSKAREVSHMLKHAYCEKLILNGDIVDGWSLHRKGGWKKEHTRLIRLILKKMEKYRTEVIYTRGNHDDALARILPIQFDNLSIVEEHIHKTKRGDYLVIHGDVFDSVTSKTPILAIMGDIGYQLLLRINRLYNRYRTWRGKEYYSLSKVIKAKVKQAVSHISNFEIHLKELARLRKCQGVICGHIHTPADKMLEEIHYLNSGDWVESLTAIVEHDDGAMEVITYKEFCSRLEEESRRKEEWEKQKDRVPKGFFLEPMAEDPEFETDPLVA